MHHDSKTAVTCLPAMWSTLDIILQQCMQQMLTDATEVLPSMCKKIQASIAHPSPAHLALNKFELLCLLPSHSTWPSLWKNTSLFLRPGTLIINSGSKLHQDCSRNCVKPWNIAAEITHIFSKIESQHFCQNLNFYDGFKGNCLEQNVRNDQAHHSMLSQK